MPRSAVARVIAIGSGQPATGGWQPSARGTSRINREVPSGIRERLAFPEPPRRKRFKLALMRLPSNQRLPK
jgi:hypothetical protein